VTPVRDLARRHTRHHGRVAVLLPETVIEERPM
jgi:hypothetical protein